MDTRDTHQIWVAWDNKMELITHAGDQDLKLVTDKAGARGGTQAEASPIKERVDRELPDYKWSIVPEGSGPTLRYLIRGDRKT